MQGNANSAVAGAGGEPAGSTDLPFRTRFVLSLLLGATVLLLYSPLVQFPFVQDDWFMIHGFTFRPSSSILLDMVAPAGKFFYRPLATLYCWLVFSIFGLRPIGFHLLAILILGVSSFLVVSLARTFTVDQKVAWGSGFLYVSASIVHIDPLMWLVGAFDIGAGFFALLCIGSFIRRRFGISAIWFAAAMGFKEGMVMLLPVLCAWTLLNGREGSDETRTARRTFSRLKWHCLAFLVFVAAKIPGVSIFGLPETDTYAARLVGSHVGDNFRRFALLGLQSVTPLKSVVFSGNGGLMTLFVATAILVLVFIAGISYVGGKGKGVGRPLVVALFIVGWFLLLIFPSLTLKNHFSRYYILAALPPLVIGTMLVLKIILHNTARNAKVILYATIVFVAANVIDGAVLIYRRVELGVLDGIHASGRDGDNHLIRKATMVREAWKPLLAVLPSVPPHSLLVLEDVQTTCFADKYGVQVWYRDSTLLVTSSVPEGPDSLGMLRATLAGPEPSNGPATPPVIPFPLSRTIFVRYTAAGMELVRNGYRSE
jgi:hypothetical protein